VEAAGRAGLDIDRDQVARLMRAVGIEDVRRTNKVRTTRADPVAMAPGACVVQMGNDLRRASLAAIDSPFIVSVMGSSA
jgi:hypothetical protein